MSKYPFAYDRNVPFIQQASDWIADVFYDILPEVGFEVRDEQIYMAFQLEKAFANKHTIFAEAGVGTGKTLVYLLYAICYARHVGKPAIIACADESLIEQLIKKEGDLAKIAEHLDLKVDARLSKSKDQYLCLMKLEETRLREDYADVYEPIYEGLPSFVRENKALQAFYPYGDRRDYPHLSDEQWQHVGWDTFQDCFVCEKRHRCGQTLSRTHYREATDLVICSHDFYMEHVWTAESRKREGQLPLLPEHSAVVFDEGHLLETAAQNALTYKLNPTVFEDIVSMLLDGEVRESLAVAVDEALMQCDILFDELERHSLQVVGSNRKEIIYTEQLLELFIQFKACIDQIEEELVFESELYTLNEYNLRIAEEHLEMIQRALSLFHKTDRLISWLKEDSIGPTLVIMPRLVQEVLAERVFSQRIPIVFSSATLSTEQSFDYLAHSLGVEDYYEFSVSSPFNYEKQVTWQTPSIDSNNPLQSKIEWTAELLEQSGGRALILFPSVDEMEQFKQARLDNDTLREMPFIFEGEQEISHLISDFQNDEQLNLCAVTLWEGLDVPGPALSHVLIWSLPFPPDDPVFNAKREQADDPFHEVDWPYMLLRLRQGIGRLIRTREDEGFITIFADDVHKEALEGVIMY